jgi:hypothetical protein
MRIVIPIVSAVIAAVLVFFLLQKKLVEQNAVCKIKEIKSIELIVQKKLEQTKSNMTKRLQSFTDAVASNRNFQFSLIVENDRSSSNVTELASQYRGPMGFSLLEITDSAFVILSSGHFPASAGNRISEKSAQLGSDPVVLDDDVMGSTKLTMQSKVLFNISEIPFWAIGGLIIDEDYLSALSPREGVTVILKRGSEYLGKSGIRSISEVKDYKILINDKDYYAAQISLPYVSDDKVPVLIVVLEE